MTWDGKGVDPWLPDRIAAEVDITSAERRVYTAWWGSLSDWLVRVKRSVIGSGVPDPNGVWTHVPLWAELMGTIVQGPIRDAIGLTYRRLFGEEFNFDARPAVVRHLAEVTNRMVRTPDEVYDVVASQVARGAASGESIPTITGRVTEVLEATGTDLWPNRAVTVARTETLGALNAGRADAFTAVAETLGGDFELVWLATLDRRVRPAHRAADWQRVPVGTPFTVDGEHLMRPGDPNGSASNVIMCRCTTLLERPGEETSQVGRGFTDADDWWAKQAVSPAQANDRKEMP
mgnify:CR=1 FL=1